MVEGRIEGEQQMKTLPNGLTVFNATPHVIRFWRENDWPVYPVEVLPDEIITAVVEEEHISTLYGADDTIELVRPTFIGTAEGSRIAREALAAGADVVVGSIIAAQAYPGLVLAMIPAPGYERVPPAEKRMLPDKFTTFAASV